MIRRCALIAMLLSSLCLAPVLPAAADGCSANDRDCVDTSGDQGTGSVVTTGVQFPNTDPDSELGTAVSANADCEDCQWAVSPACSDSGPVEGGCAGAMVGWYGAQVPGAVKQALKRYTKFKRVEPFWR